VGIGEGLELVEGCVGESLAVGDAGVVDLSNVDEVVDCACRLAGSLVMIALG
jgi:hypothetical protein